MRRMNPYVDAAVIIQADQTIRAKSLGKEARRQTEEEKEKTLHRTEELKMETYVKRDIIASIVSLFKDIFLKEVSRQQE